MMLLSRIRGENPGVVKLIAIFLLSSSTTLLAAEFKSVKECIIGTKVADRSNATGTVVSADSSMCRIRLDGSGETRGYLFWMLHPAGASAETDDKLVTGDYQCHAGSQAAGRLRITGPRSYESSGKTGTYRVEPSRKIVFESGPFSSYNAKLLAGPKIGLNMSGGTFYSVTCDPKK